MKKILTLLGILFLTSTAWAASVQDRVALALAHGKNSSCTCVDCTCTAGECGNPNCPTLVGTARPGPLEWQIYLMQYRKALALGKPLLVWVGETCPACENQWREYVHARLSEWSPSVGTSYFGPGVIVGKTDGFGGITSCGELSGIPTKTAVAGLLSNHSNPRDDPTYDNVNPYNRNPHWPYQSFVQPVVFTPTMGSFGGGGRAGGG